MNIKSMRGALMALLLILVNSFLAAQEDENVLTLLHDGVQRQYVLHSPADLDDSTSAPLLIALHGAGGTAESMARITGLNVLADIYGFRAAYPDSYDGTWDYLDIPIDQDTVIDDTGFISALVDHLSATYAVDTGAVYVTGFSNGGLMAVRLRCSLADRIAAVAVVGATMTFRLSQVCLTAPPLPLMVIIGTRDTAFPWDGYAEVEDGVMYSSFSVPQMMSYMASLNRCQRPPTVETVSLPESPVEVRWQQHHDCDQDFPVMLYALMDYPHGWPLEPLVHLESGDAGSLEHTLFEFFAAHVRQE